MGVADSAPADGVLLDGEALFEESLLTGESSPVLKQPGDALYAGTACREMPARARVACTGPQTRLSQLTRLVEQAQAHRPRVAQLADRISSRFVAWLLLTTVLVYLGWRWYDPSRALEVTLALLVISCPCALSLSVPTALAAAHGTLARLGVLATRPDAMETLARATDVVFDKTGTLTTSQPALASVDVFDGHDRERVLAIAAALERDANHPIAAAFAAFDQGLPAQAVIAAPGRGIEGDVSGRHWKLGQALFAAGRPDDGRLWLGNGVQPAACFTLREEERADAADALARLRGLGLQLHLSSGDAAAPVAASALRLGIDDAQSRQSPEQKLARVRTLQAEGRIVAMIGDGLNDAPVLAGADVSMAMGEGASLAQRAADLVMTGSTLLRIPATIAIARRTQRVIAQNLGWALAYNLLAIPLAAAGLVTPWIAALGMALSSLAVTLNALRLTRIPT